MYQYRNLPPRHQPPGFYPPHQPSLRRQQYNVGGPNISSEEHYSNHTPLTRSHSHGLLHTSPHNNPNGYRTHHIISPVHSPPPQHTHSHSHSHHSHSHHSHNHNKNPNALYAIQQVQRIKAATACQIINNRVVEAIREQQMKKLAEKVAKKKANPNWKDPNETNPNNPAYKGPLKSPLNNHMSYKKSYTIDMNDHKDSSSEEEEEEDDEEQDKEEKEEKDVVENDTTMTIPQLEISTAPKSTANITNLTDEELKMNPELYKMYSYYIPFASPNHSSNHSSSHSSSHLRSQSLRSQSTPPINSNKHHHRTNMGPRRRNPNFLKPQYNETINDKTTHKLVPIINNNNNKQKKVLANMRTYEGHIAPAHANVQSVISPNGGIYHPCHGYSTRDISIFDLFPGIVKYQSKKYAECDRVDYLLTLSEKSFCSVNNRPLQQINESEMWYIALKYLFNDITLGQFDYMSLEMRYVIKQYMSTHKNRITFLNSIKTFGFLRVISDISKKLPIERIQKLIRAEKEKAEKEKLLHELTIQNRIKEENRKKLLLQQQHYIMSQSQFIPQPQHYNTQPHHYNTQQHQQHQHSHYSDWYNGNRLKRTISEPSNSKKTIPPTIIDDNDMDDMDNINEINNDNDIDDSWNFITQIVNNNKINKKINQKINNNKIPDLPPEKLKQSIQTIINNKPSNDITNDIPNDMDEIVDVYTMLYQTMKDENINNNTTHPPEDNNTNDNGPNISFADLTNINNNISDHFVPKVNSEK